MNWMLYMFFNKVNDLVSMDGAYEVRVSLYLDFYMVLEFEMR